jgi:hypothetical protein
VQEARLNAQDYWLVKKIQIGSQYDTKRIAFDNDSSPSGTWPLRHDFAFLQCSMPTNVFFIPQVQPVSVGASVAVIGYTLGLDVEEISCKYDKDYYMPSTYDLQKVFTQLDQKFLSSGTAKNNSEFLQEHTANAGASTSRGVVIDLTNNQSLNKEPFLFAGLRMYLFFCFLSS